MQGVSYSQVRTFFFVEQLNAYNMTVTASTKPKVLSNDDCETGIHKG